MASILKVDTITGVATAGSIAVTGEGNSTTTNLQQGLCKVWGQSASNGASIADSFNCASLTDTGTGRQNWNFTNNMNNDDYSCVISPLGNNISEPFIQSQSTSEFEGYMYDEGAASAGDIAQCVTVHGDLA